MQYDLAMCIIIIIILHVKPILTKYLTTCKYIVRYHAMRIVCCTVLYCTVLCVLCCAVLWIELGVVEG